MEFADLAGSPHAGCYRYFMQQAYQIARIAGLGERVTCAESDLDRRWVVKTPHWPPVLSWDCFNIRMGAELLYYNIALQNKLPMPESDVLIMTKLNFFGMSFHNVPCWGTEFRPERTAIGTGNDISPSLIDLVEKSLGETKEQIDAYLRAIFLDVMLLNGDRTVSNILGSVSSAGMSLYYFDHEQSFGWKNCIEVYGKNRITSPADEWGVVSRYLVVERKYKWARRFSDYERRHRVFRELVLEPRFLDGLRPQVVPRWISHEQFDLIQEGLAAWWQFLRGEPYKKLDAQLFEVP